MNKTAKCHIKKGDSVVVIAGDDKGKTGKVLQITTQARALVEGVNFMKKHMKKTQDNPQGGVVEREAPIAVSNLKVSV
ncbi:MAG: 50S ribosomal protein L24 [Kiritimatiellales bacterium]|nr:50S ribosomal protein L24 [Kiritimatiellales bacterium]MCF7864844.1 50S ribosomal protein L24 [Kiritimatiellales bacterium]